MLVIATGLYKDILLYTYKYVTILIELPTLLRILGTIWIIQTRDHGFPHVTVYKGTPSNHEAMAKFRLDVVEVIESRGFTKDFLNEILAITHEYQTLLLEAWNEIHEKEK